MSIKKMPTAKPAAFDPSITEIWKRLEKLEQAVFTGNGTPSLKERVAAMDGLTMGYPRRMPAW